MVNAGKTMWKETVKPNWIRARSRASMSRVGGEEAAVAWRSGRWLGGSTPQKYAVGRQAPVPLRLLPGSRRIRHREVCRKKGGSSAGGLVVALALPSC